MKNHLPISDNLSYISSHQRWNFQFLTNLDLAKCTYMHAPSVVRGLIILQVLTTLYIVCIVNPGWPNYLLHALQNKANGCFGAYCTLSDA